MRVVTSFNNFSRGKIDHDTSGRYDLPIYQSGSDLFRNWFSNFKGNAIYRRGFESILPFQDCAFVEFKFSNSQNYLLCFYLNKIRFLSYDVNGNFGWVLDGALNILEVTTPYTLLQTKSIQFTQNRDVMIVTYPGIEPYQLKRTAANAFSFNPQTRKDDPFSKTWAATKTVTAITQATQALVTINAHGYNVNDRLLFAAVVGMTQINGYTATVVQVNNVNQVTIDLDTTTFTAYSSGGTTARVVTGDYPRCCLFYRARLYYANTPLKGTTVWGSQSAKYDTYTLPASPVDTDAISFTLTDITQAIDWLFGGDNSLLGGSADGVVAINGGDVNEAITSASVTSTLTSAPGCNETIPIRKDGLIFYVGNDGRNMYYFKYDLINASFKAQDANLIAYDITLGGMGKIRWKKDRDDLVYALRGDGVLLSMNFKEDEKINGWHEHETPNGHTFVDQAVITDNDGKPQLFALVNRAGTYYIEHQSPGVEFVRRHDFFTDKDSKATDQNAYIRMICEQLKECNHLDNSQEVYNLQDNPITYDPGAGTITDTDGVFVSGDVGKHIVYKTLTGYESGRFLITGRTNANVVTVDVLQEPTQNTYQYWYLTFQTVTGLSQYNGTTIAAVTEGGFLTTFEVSGGSIDLGKQVTHARVGYNYRGVIKSFDLGFAFQGQNSQGTLKTIQRVGARCVATAGLKIGSSQYELQDVQDLNQGDLNYLPPVPIDGTKYISFVDGEEFDKCVYLVQEDPLPAVVTALMVDANYATNP